LATASWDLWQKEQRKTSSDPDRGFTWLLLTYRDCILGGARSFLFVLVDDLVDDPVFLALLRVHDEIALDVFLNFIKFLPGMLGQ